jgi:hypothetical protein
VPSRTRNGAVSMDTLPTRRAFMNTTDISDLSELGLPIQLPGRVRFNVGPAVAEGIVEAVIPSRDLAEEFAHLAGAAPRGLSALDPRLRLPRAGG